jgi:hypothetical protein
MPKADSQAWLRDGLAITALGVTMLAGGLPAHSQVAPKEPEPATLRHKCGIRKNLAVRRPPGF